MCDINLQYNGINRTYGILTFSLFDIDVHLLSDTKVIIAIRFRALYDLRNVGNDICPIPCSWTELSSKTTISITVSEVTYLS